MQLYIVVIYQDFYYGRIEGLEGTFWKSTEEYEIELRLIMLDETKLTFIMFIVVTHHHHHRSHSLRALVAQWVVRPTHTRLVPGSKHDWCKNPLVFAMIAG